MPRGLMISEERDPLSFTMAEWQQAKRHNLDPRTIKQTIQECWAVSDSRAAFAAVLQERGYYLGGLKFEVQQTGFRFQFGRLPEVS